MARTNHFIVYMLLAPMAAACGMGRNAGNDHDGRQTGQRLELTSDEVRFLRDRTMPRRLDQQNVSRIIADAAQLMEHGGAKTRAKSGEQRTVGKIRPLVLPVADKTRTQAVRDTVFHIVDFANEMGYCIVAADRRVPDEIICFVGDGSFPENEITNPGLRFIMDAINSYAQHHVSAHSRWCDSVEKALLAKTDARSIDELIASTQLKTASRAEAQVDPAGEPAAEANELILVEPRWEFNRRVGPMLPVEWDQGAPFNASVVANTPWKTTPVGCVALAAAQIMAYWRVPETFHGTKLDWDEITRWSAARWNRIGRYRNWDGPMSAAPEETRRVVADMMWNIGQDVGMSYGSSASYAYTYRATKMLSNNGLTPTDAWGYTKARTLASIDAGRPVFIEGASHATSDREYFSNEHCWVVDGYLEQCWRESFKIDFHTYNIELLRGFFHSNFGWGGLDNGFYATGLFDANNNPDMPSDSAGPTRRGTGTASRTATRVGFNAPAASSDDGSRVEWIGQNYNYQFLLTVYPNIHLP